MEKDEVHCYGTHSSEYAEDNISKHYYETHSEWRCNQPPQEEQLWWKDQELFRPAASSSNTCSPGFSSRAEARRSEDGVEVHALDLPCALGRQNACFRISPVPAIIEDERTGNGGTSGADRGRYEDSFAAVVDRFVFDHVEAINVATGNPVGRVLHCNDEAGEALCANPEALEYHTQANPITRKRRFFELVAVGDVVRGLVTLKRSSELRVKVLSFVDTHKMRELLDLNIKGLVSFEHLGPTREKRDEVLEDTREGDVIQAIAVGVDTSEEVLQLSFCPVPALDRSVHLGYLEGEKSPHPLSKYPAPDDFLRRIESDPGFGNPMCVDNLKVALGITNMQLPSLLNCIRRSDFSKENYFDSLRKAQRCKWSLDNVATGVQHFKSGDNKAAMRYYNHALEIDSNNVEGLVARGALYANSGQYEQAIKDFRAALTIKHSHKNARKYLLETQTAYGQELEKKGDLERAVKCYRSIVLDDPTSEAATKRLEVILALQESQAAEKREKERKKAEEKAKLKRLQEIIEEEKNKLHKEGHKKKHKHKGRRSDSQDTMVAGPSLPPGMTKTKKRSSKKKHRTRSSRSKSERRTSSPSSDSDVSSKHKNKRSSRDHSRGRRESSTSDSDSTSVHSSRTKSASSVRGES